MVFVYAESPFRGNDTVYILDELGIEYSVVSELQEYLTLSTSNTKLAILVGYKSIQYLEELSQCSNLVFVVESELHSIPTCTKDNVYWSLPGIVDSKNNYSFNGHWLSTTTELYGMVQPNKLLDLQPYRTKPKYFDALLGSVKSHRTFIYDSIFKSDIAQKIIISYNPASVFDASQFYANDYFIWEPGTEKIDNMRVLDTTSIVTYFGISTHLSQIVPIDIYNQSCYSIVAETTTSNDFSFFTEKTAKPILAKRLFVMFSGYRFLANLRHIGFKTFNGIIDESYDLIVDPDRRFNEAFKQVIDLCNRPQKEVLDLIKPITEYNYNFIQSLSWKDRDKEWMKNIILTQNT